MHGPNHTLSGCSAHDVKTMITKTDIKVFAEINEAGNRLRLNLIKLPPPRPFLGFSARDPNCHDFHSLVWEVADGLTWVPKAIITHEDLETEHVRRWVSDVHSLNPVAGSAIIRVGEDDDWRGRIIYSWREWDLCRNQQLRMIKECRLPSDWKYESDNGA